jgi:hypothetical protein
MPFRVWHTMRIRLAVTAPGCGSTIREEVSFTKGRPTSRPISVTGEDSGPSTLRARLSKNIALT